MSNYTGATALLEALVLAGVTHLFVNLGSDHPALLEVISKWRREGKSDLKVLTAPNEFVGLCAAQGYYQATGEMQAILVHVDAGTMAMAGAIHNVARARIPVLMIAGTSPITEENEMTGTRNEFIHYLQDTIDQRGIIRGYTVYDNEIRTGRNVKQLVLRASQLAKSEPQGPAYLMAAREVMEEEIVSYEVNARKWKALAPNGLSPASLEEIGNALINASCPVVVTTYLGREEQAVTELVKLCETLGVAVLEALPAYLNFPRSHELYMGNHWSETPQDSMLRTADLVLVLDCDVPWIKAVFKPRSDASVYHIDCDPLKVQMSLFHLDTDLSCQANSKIALEQLNTFVASSKISPRGEVIRSRIEDLKARHDLYRTQINEQEILSTSDEVITPHYALSRLRMMLDESSVILSEAISNYRPVADVLLCNLPGSYFTSGATALGWHGGAAIGVKLAHPEKTVISVTGDGTFLFSIPSTVHWMSRKYNAPFLTVILNNRGWKSPMLSAIAVHKDGFSSQMTSDDLHVTFDPPPDYAQVAVAAGAGYGKTVKLAKDIDQALKEGLETVREGRSAVIDIWLPKFTVGDRVG